MAMNDFAEVVEAMNALVKRFGIEACSFAMEVSRIRCSNVPIVPAISTEPMTPITVGKKDREYGELRDLALLYCMNSSLPLTVTILHELSKTLADALLATLHHYGLQHPQCPTAAAAASVAAGTQSKSLGYLLVDLPFPSSVVVPILQHPSVGTLFEHICIQSWTPKLQRTTDAVSALGVSLHQSCFKERKLTFRNLHFSPQLLMLLGRMIADGSVCYLSLDECRFDPDPMICANTFSEGFGKSSRFSSSTCLLKDLDLDKCRWSDETSQCIVRSLGGVPTLTKLKIRKRISGSLAKGLTQALLNPVCRITILVIYRGRDPYSAFDLPDRECSAALCSALKQSRVTSLWINYEIHLVLLQELFRLALSPGCPIQSLTTHSSDSWWKHVDASNIIIDEAERSSADEEPQPQCSRIRSLGIINGCHESSADLRGQISFWLPLVSSGRLPYLRCLGWNCTLWDSDRRHYFFDYYFEDKDDKSRKIFHIDEETKSALDELCLWLDRNHCGRALLHPYWSNRVPPGVWPMLLADALKGSGMFNSKGERWSVKHGGGPLLDGMYYLLQGMIQGGHIGGQRSAGSCLEPRRLLPEQQQRLGDEENDDDEQTQDGEHKRQRIID